MIRSEGGGCSEAPSGAGTVISTTTSTTTPPCVVEVDENEVTMKSPANQNKQTSSISPANQLGRQQDRVRQVRKESYGLKLLTNATRPHCPVQLKT